MRRKGKKDQLKVSAPLDFKGSVPLWQKFHLFFPVELNSSSGSELPWLICSPCPPCGRHNHCWLVNLEWRCYSTCKDAGASVVAFLLDQERMALERWMPTKLSALKDRLIAAFDKSLYLSSHSREIAYKTFVLVLSEPERFWTGINIAASPMSSPATIMAF